MFEIAQYALWFLLPPLQITLAYWLWKEKSFRKYPIFFAYVLEQLIRFAILFYYFEKHLRTEYSHSYSILQGIEAVLQVGVICELFSEVLRPYESLRRFGTAILRWSGMCFLFLATLVAVYSVGRDSSHFLTQLFGMERSAEIVQAGMLLVIAIVSLVFAVQWNRQTLGLVLGFGLFISVNLIAYTVRFQLGISSQHILSLISNVVYDFAVLIWLFSFHPKSKARPPSETGSESWDPSSWNQAFTQLLRR